MVQNYTTIEQGKKLLEMGIDPETADMLYYTIKPDVPVCQKPFIFLGQDMEIPCWSLAALIDLLPDCIEIHRWRIYEYKLCMSHKTISYRVLGDDLVKQTAGNLLEAVLKMIGWLLENNHIPAKND